MRHTTMTPLICAVLLTASCRDATAPVAPVESGKLVVRVVWDGAYTLRAYDINRGGPAMLDIDTKVTIGAGKEVRIEVLDCLPCV